MTARSRLVRRLQRHGRIGTLVGSPSEPDAPAVLPAPVASRAVPGPVIIPQAAPVARSASPEPDSTPPPAAPDSSRPEHLPAEDQRPEDAAWRKLRTIYTLHQEKEAAEDKGEGRPVGDRPEINVVRKPEGPAAPRRSQAPPRVQRAEEEEPPVVERPEPAPEPAEPAGGAPDAGTGDDPETAGRQVSGLQAEMDQELQLPKPDAPEEDHIQRMFPSSQMGGMGTGFPDPFIPPVASPVPLPFPPIGGGPVPLPFPGFPGHPGGPFGGGGGGGGPTVPPESGGTEIGGEATVGGNMQSGGGIEVGGSANAGGSISAGGALTAGGNVSGMNVSAGTGVTAGANVEAGGNITAGTSVDAGGNLESGGSLSAGGAVSAGADASAGTDMTVQGGLETGANVSPGSDLNAAGPVEAGANVSTGGKLAGESNLTAGGNVISIGGIDVGANMQVGAALMSMGDVEVGGAASSGAAMVSMGDTDVSGPATVGGLVMANGELSFGAAAAVGGAVIAKGKTSVEGTLSTSVFKGQDVDLSGSFATNTVKANTLSAGGSVTIGGRADVGTINASSVTIHGPTKVSSGGGSVATKPAEVAPEPGVPLNQAWPVQRRSDAALPEIPTAVRSDSNVEFIPPRGPRPDSGHTTGGSPDLQAKPVRSTEPKPTVRTEIGDLPADLWQLLGKERPAEGDAPGAGARTERPVPPIGPPPAPVQRAAADEPAEDAAGETDSGPDVEALARKVYSQLRRRLHIEAERTRHGKS